MKKIRVITGASSGFGRAMAQQVLKNGDIAIGTFRQKSDLDFFVQHPNAFGYILDIRDFDNASKIAEQIIKDFGQIDFLINNAGIGMIGAIHELSLTEMKSVMDTNLWGVVNFTKCFIKMFCRQKKGTLIFMSSQEGFVANPGFGAYNMSKFALEGFAQALALELGGCGVNTMIVNPGPFRTDFLKSIKFSQMPGSDFEKVQKIKEFVKDNIGKEPGDVQLGAKLIIDAAQSPNPPLHLVLGKIAIRNISKHLQRLEKDINDRKEKSVLTD